MQVIVCQFDNRPITTYSEPKKLKWVGGKDWNQEKETFADANRGNLSHPYDYWSLTSIANKLAVRLLGENYYYEHHSVAMNGRDIHPSWMKWENCINKLHSIIPIYEKWLRISLDVSIVMLDSDAWICDSATFAEKIEEFENSDKSIWLSEETKHELNDSMGMKYNGGFAAFKLSGLDICSELVSKMFGTLKEPELSKYTHQWPMEQYALNRVILENESIRNSLFVTPVHETNTPAGSIIRHCWWKGGLLGTTCKDDILAMTVKLLEID